jgi:hypothetical protein
MRYGPIVFLAAFLTLSASWCGFVLTPQIQLGRAVQETNSVVKAELYPQGRPGLARAGLEVYRADGCFYCHSQQVDQKKTLVDVFLTDAGKTPTAVAQALEDAHAGTFSAPGLAAGLPKPVLRNATMESASVLASLLKKRAQLRSCISRRPVRTSSAAGERGAPSRRISSPIPP